MNIYDAHVSGSLSVSGSAEISGDLNVLGLLNANISGTITNAVTAALAPSYLLTSSFQTFTASYQTGSFTGSFKGDGTELYNIPATGITGLNLSRIASTSATASITAAGGFKVNTNAEITGSLTVTGNVIGAADFTSLRNLPTLVSGSSQLTGSYDTRYILSGSITETTWDNIANKPTGIVSASIQVELTGVTGYSTFSSSISSSILGLSSSVATTTSGLSSSMGSLSSSIATTTNNLSSSIATTNSTQDGRLNNLEASTGSLNTFTSSINTTIKDKLNVEAVKSGSIQINITGTTGYSTFTGSITSSIGSLSSSIAITTSDLSASIAATEGNLSSSIGELSSSIATTTVGLSSSIASLSGSVATTTSGLSSSIGSLSSSVATTTINNYNTLSSSIGSLSSSVATTDSNQNGRLNSIQGATGSLNSFTSSINTTIKDKLNVEGVISGSIQIDITSTTGYSTFSSSINTSIGDLSGSVATTTLNLSSSIATTTLNLSSSVSTSIGNLSSSVATTTLNLSSSISTSIGNLSSSVATLVSSSVNSLSGSVATTTLNLSSSIATTTLNLSSSVSTSIGSLSSSIATTTLGLSSSINSISGSITASLGLLSSSIGSLSSSVATTTLNLSSSVATTTLNLSSSVSTSIGSLSSSIATTDRGQNTRIGALEDITGSYATTGSNRFNGNQTITGSLIITQNLTVFGSSSITYVTSSQLRIDDNVITLNTSTPGQRFGGIEVYDSGSINQATGSILWDSVNNRWIYQQSSEATYGGGVLMSGPRSSGSLGDELTLTSGKIARSAGGDHLNDSIITETGGTAIGISGSLSITGSVLSTVTPLVSGSSQIDITGTTGYSTFSSSISTSLGAFSSSAASYNLTQDNRIGSLETMTGSLSAATSSIQSRLGAIEISTGSLNTYTSSNNTVIGTLQTSTSSLNTYTSSNNTVISTLQTSTGSLNTYTSSNNTVIGTLQTSTSSLNSYTTSTNTRLGVIETTTGSLNSYTSSNNTRLGVIETSTSSLNTFTSSASGRLTSLESASSSIRTDFNSYTSSNNGRVNALETASGSAITRLGSLETASGSAINRLGSLETASGSIRTDFNSYTSSANGRLTSIEGVTGSISSLNTYTGSNNTTNTTQNNRLDSIEGKTGSIASLNTYTGSNDTTNTTQNSRLTSIETMTGSLSSATSSIQGRLTSIETMTGSLSSATSSIQGRLNTIETSTSSLNTYTSSNNTIIGTLQTSTSSLNSFTNSINTTIKSRLTAEGVISGSSQVLSGTGIWSGSAQLPSGVVSGSAQIVASLPAGTVSGSSQITLSSTTGFGTYINQAVLTTSTPTFAATTINGTLSVTIDNGYVLLTRSATNKYIGIDYRTSATEKWFVGLRENLTSDNYIIYNANTNSDSLTLNTTSNAATFIGAVTASNFSGTYTGTSSGTNTGDQTTITGNAGTATTLQTARNIYGNSFNGSADVTSTISNTYLANPSFYVGTTSITLGRTSLAQTLAGVSVDGSSSQVTQTLTGTNAANLLYAPIADNDYARIRVGGDATNSGWMELATADDGTEPIYVRQYTGVFATVTRTATLLDGSGNTTFPGTINGLTVSSGTITAGTWNGTTIAVANGGTAATTAAAARTNLGLVIGTDVLAYRTFGTAANNATGDFATAAQGTKADNALPLAGGTMTGNLLFSNKGINIKRDSGAGTGISWYSTGYSSWCDYMSPAATTSCGPNANITAPAGTYVTSWGLRRFIEDSAGYGWTWESGTANQTTPTVKAELRSSDGLFSVAGAIYSAGNLVKHFGNSTYATTFSSVSSVTVTHSLGSKDVLVMCYDSSDNMFWPSSIVTTSTSVVTITFASSRSGRVVVVR